jgi:thiol:disulfide interchange protein DsbC
MTMKRIMLFAGLVAILLPLSVPAFPGKDPKGGDCTKCHKLEKKEAEEVVKKLIPGGAVVGIKQAPVKSFWLIEVEQGGRRGAIYLDFSKKYVGQIAAIDQIGKPQERKVDFSKISLSDAVVLGAADAKRKVAVFTDPDCPYCRKLHEEMKKVVEKRPDIAFYLMLFPLEMHKDAYKKAQAILCDKSLALADDAFSGKAVPEPKCPPDLVEKIKAVGASLGINGTPAIIREDGTLMSGYLPADDLIAWIEKK